MKNLTASVAALAALLAFGLGCQGIGSNPGTLTANTANSTATANATSSIATESKPAADQKLFTSETGGFSIAAPGEMTETSQDVPTPAGNIKVSLYQTSTGENAFIVGYSDFPAKMLKQVSAEKLLDGARDGAVQNVRGTLVSDTKITLDGNPGREVVLTGKAPTGQEASAKARYYLVKNRLYQMMVVTPKESGDAAGTDDFLQSFKLQN